MLFFLFALFSVFYFSLSFFFFFFFNDTATTEIYTLSLHDRSSDPPPARPLREYLPQQRDERNAIRDASRHGGVKRIRGELRPAGDPAEARELAVVADREDDVAVGGGEHFVGHHVRVRVAVTSRGL